MGEQIDKVTVEEKRAVAVKLRGLKWKYKEIAEVLNVGVCIVHRYLNPEYHAKKRAETAEWGKNNRDRINKREKAKWETQPIPHWAAENLKGVRARAKEKSVPFDLDKEHLISKFPIDNKCPVFGTAFEFGIGSFSYNAPSIDRIDPNGGYTKDNTIIVSFKANKIKGDFAACDLIKVADFYANRT